MPTKPLDRLMFAQGGLCFFCDKALPQGEASVEHLVASANGGANGDDNCVACCKALNALFGSMSLKEKIGLVLNQKGIFTCPNSNQRKASKQAKALGIWDFGPDHFGAVIANLRQRGTAKPKTVKTLMSTIRALRKGITDEELGMLCEQLQTAGFISINGSKVVYGR
jgi:hypothetical protein